MANKRSFVLPTGLGMSVEEGTLSIEFDGDVVLEDTLGYNLGSVKAGGDLHIAAASVDGTLSAGGDIRVGGDVTGGAIEAGGSVSVDGGATNATIEAGSGVNVGGGAEGATIISGGKLSIGGDVIDTSLAGADIHLGAGEIKAKAIAATQSIHVGDAKLTVDVLQAPKVKLGKGATGRVTVIDAASEPGPSKIKGGFSLEDYEEMFGDAATFLADRGLTPLGADAPVAEEEPEPDEAEVDPAIEPEAEGAEEEVSDEEPEIEELELEIEEETEMLNPDDLEPVDMEELTPVDEAGEGELRTQLEETLATIDSCYEGDAPPALASLRELVENNDFTGLREDINSIWNELLKYHQKKRLRPPHQVTHAFNTIHSLIQNS